MSSTVELLLSGEDLASTLGRRLFVSWQDPDTRTIVPVARLRRVVADGSADYEFRYLRRVLDLSRFRPFVSFPRFRGVYRAPRLFPLFENRLIHVTERTTATTSRRTSCARASLLA